MANEELPNSFRSDAEILKERQIGLDRMNASPAARPYFTPSPSLRNRVQAALGAFGQGGQAVQAYTRGNPTPDAFGAFMAGAGGGLGAPTAQDIAAAEAKRNAEIQMAQLEATPIEQVSPDIADRFGLHGVPLGMINRIAPFLQRHDDLEKQLALIAARGEEARKTSAETASRRSEEMLTRQTIDEDAAMFHAANTGLPASFFVGQRRPDVEKMMPTIRKSQELSGALLTARNSMAELKRQYDAAVGGMNEAEMRAAAGMSSATLGNKYPEIAAYQRSRAAQITSIRKAFQDSGAPSNFDVERLLGYIPDVSVLGASQKQADKMWDNAFSLQKKNEGYTQKTYPTAKYYLGASMPAPSAETPESIRADYKAGRLTKEQARAKIKALGGN